MNRALLMGVALMLHALGCGGDDSAPPGPMDAGAGDASCAPQLPNPWVPTWRPPRATLRACTDAQIETELRLCETESTYSATACAAFNRDAANLQCRRCLYTTEDENAYGPFVYLRNRVLRINVPGCLALADGQLGASSCGAQMQAFQACGDAACMTTCAAYDAFSECVARAEDGVCSPYRLDSACGNRTTYAACLDLGTFADYYRGVAKLFCGSGFGDGGSADAGTSDVMPRPSEIEARVRVGKGEAAGHAIAR